MNYLNSLPNYLGFLTGMSKFFKWLKKDKQQEEPSVVVQVPLPTSIEQVNSEPGIINRKTVKIVQENTIGLKRANIEKNISLYSCN